MAKKLIKTILKMKKLKSKKIAIFTTSRADFGLLREFIKKISFNKNFKSFLIVSGSHLEKKSGFTINEIIQSKFKIYSKININVTNDQPKSIAKSISIGMIKFTSTSFIRGHTIENNVVLVDECQNMTFHELDTIITRLGRNCRIIFCGDFRQSDLQKEEDRSGLRRFMQVIKTMKGMSGIEFEQDDIVRSSFVKEYIISKLNYGIV